MIVLLLSLHTITKYLREKCKFRITCLYGLDMAGFIRRADEASPTADEASKATDEASPIGPYIFSFIKFFCLHRKFYHQNQH